MTVEEFINKDYFWKEIIKKMIDNNVNFDGFTKEVMKLCTELQYEYNKSQIMAKYNKIQYIIQINNSNK